MEATAHAGRHGGVVPVCEGAQEQEKVLHTLSEESETCGLDASDGVSVAADFEPRIARTSGPAREREST